MGRGSGKARSVDAMPLAVDAWREMLTGDPRVAKPNSCPVKPAVSGTMPRRRGKALREVRENHESEHVRMMKFLNRTEFPDTPAPCGRRDGFVEDMLVRHGKTGTCSQFDHEEMDLGKQGFRAVHRDPDTGDYAGVCFAKAPARGCRRSTMRKRWLCSDVKVKKRKGCSRDTEECSCTTCVAVRSVRKIKSREADRLARLERNEGDASTT